MLNKFLILLVTSLVCLLFVGAASAVTNSEPAYTPTVVTDHSEVDGHNVVYEKKVSDTKYDIYVTDLTTGTSSLVSDVTTDNRNPDISGNIVVWQAKASGGKWQIYYNDMSNNHGSWPVYPSSNDQINPSISGSYVVWQEYHSASDADTNNQYADYDIKKYDLSGNYYYPNMAVTNHCERNPVISGNIVLYERYENVGTTSSPNWKWQVYQAVYGTGGGVKIHPSTENQNTPVISEQLNFNTNKVLWSEFNKATNSYDIWCEDLAMGTGFWVTKTTENEYYPDISGYIAVWDKQVTTSNRDIVMQDISSSSNPKINIAKGTSVQRDPAVDVDQYGIFVSFTDNKDGTYRVYWRNMDTTLPKPTSGSPARNAVDVPLNKIITTTFSEPIKLGAGTIKLVSSTGTVIPITKSVSGNKILTISPAILLKKATKYTLILAAGSVTDYAGNPIAAYSRPFTTDSTPPKAIAGSPARNAVNVYPDQVITTTFNEPIIPGNMWITLRTASGTEVAITPVINGKVLTIYHAQLAKGTKYVIELHTGCISDIAGNSIKYYYRYFTTDDTPPKAIAGSPARNAVNVNRDQVITTTFNEPIKADNMWITLTSASGREVAITPVINGNVLYIHHLLLLAPSTKYLMELHTGCISDLSGNPLKYYYRYFTTAAT
jgi:methionine-rich copper-binding protein CopC